MSAPRTGFADINGARIYYEVAGAGHPLVLVHAGIADSRMWDDQFAAFAKQYRTVRYDLRGFGRTEMVAGPFSHREDLHGLLRFLGIDRAHLLGCSMGGATIIDFALERPGLISALVPVCAGVSGNKRSGPPPKEWAELEAADRAGDLERVSELEVRIWVDGPHRTPDQVDPAIRDKVRAMNLIALRTPEDLGSEGRLDPPAIGRLGEIGAPTLVIVGDLDQPHVVATADRLAAAVAGARRAVIAGAAHLPNMERPAEFNRLVLDFLARAPERAPA